VRVLLINDYGSIVGGAEYQFLSLRDGLRARGHEARFFAARRPGSPAVADATCFAFSGSLQVLSMWKNPFAVAALRRELEAFPPDLVHLGMFRWQLSPAILDVIAALPTVVHLQLYEPICPVGSKLLPDGRLCHHRVGPACRENACFGALAAPFLFSADAATRRHWVRFSRRIAVSEWQRRRLEDDGLAIDAVIPNGIPLESAPLAALSVEPRLVCATRLAREKGVDHLLRAFARLAPAFPTLRLTIAGDGPDARSLRQLAATLPGADRVDWLGFLPRAELAAKFAGAWLQIVPGLWEEPFGLATAEALSRGVPVVAPASGASRELIAGGEFGALYPNGDDAALAEAIAGLLSQPERLASIGLAAREHARLHFSETSMVERFLLLYAEVLAG